MKIKQMLTTLLDGEDFSDHSTGKEDGNNPLHDKGCAFCEAWRTALWWIGPECPKFADFEPGERVMLPGGIRGRVIATDTAVRVEVQNGEHGPWAVGSFQPRALLPLSDEVEEFTYWRDCDGGIWKRHEQSKAMLLVRDEDGNIPYDTERIVDIPSTWRNRANSVEKRWGPLTRTEKP